MQLDNNSFVPVCTWQTWYLNLFINQHRLLNSTGHHDEALAVAERGRTRAFADLLVERQTGQQDSDPYTPVTVEHILETVNSQRALVLYFSMAAGYLYSWLLAPGAGKVWLCSVHSSNWKLFYLCGETSFVLTEGKAVFN